jgi:hypothetical protein
MASDGDSNNEERGTCPLCLEEKALRISHIVPAFAGRYLKGTSATGYLRGAANPNLREQDVPKQRLLCGDCEQCFSVWEREFSLRAFPLVQDDAFRELAYGPWLLKFAVSLSWRILVVDREALSQEFPQFEDQIAKRLEGWRRFLLGHQRNPGSEHHLFVFAGMPEQLPADAHPKLLHYLFRAIDVSEAVSSRKLAVYAKILRCFFFSPITPASPSGWHNTRIHCGDARLMSPQKIAMAGFGEFLMSRVEEGFGNPPSQEQMKKISEAVLKDPARAMASGSYKVHVASRKLIKPSTGEDGPH